MQETRARSLGCKDPLEKEMATHSSILAWEISRTEGPGGLQSNGLQSQTTTTTAVATGLQNVFSFQSQRRAMAKTV